MRLCLVTFLWFFGTKMERTNAFAPSSTWILRRPKRTVISSAQVSDDFLDSDRNIQDLEKMNNAVEVDVLVQQSIQNILGDERNSDSVIDTIPILHPTEMENVGAVLAASEEAAAAAASMENIAVPSVGKILRFAIPAIGVWLCGPILSLIDTSSVGILSGTTQQAALNPAVAVTDYAALLIAFLYTGATNMIAAAREKDRGLDAAPRTAKNFVGALQLSTYVGLGLGAFLFCFARVLLRAIIGNDAVSPEIFNAAMKYVRIRALGMPAAAVIGSAQAACLGMQDIRSPLYVLFAAAIVNFCGDMLFVGSTHSLIGGAAGAAWATVFSQYAALGLFLHWLCNKPRNSEKPLNLSNAILELTGMRSSGGGDASRRRRFREALYSWAPKTLRRRSPEKSISVRGFLSGKFQPRELVRLPTRETVDAFKEYVVPCTTAQVGRVSGYIAMSHVVSSSLGYLSMAAQQVIVSLFYCLCPIADSLSLTAQSFVPAIAERQPGQAKMDALRRTRKNFVKSGAIFGAVMATAVTCIPLVSGCFTADAEVVALVNKVVPFLVAFFSVHGILQASEGLLMGQKDLGFLGKMYGIFFVVLPYLMLQIKKSALSGNSSINLTSVWQLFVAYQFTRFTTWTLRLMMLQRRADQAATKLEYSGRFAAAAV